VILKKGDAVKGIRFASVGMVLMAGTTIVSCAFSHPIENRGVPGQRNNGEKIKLPEPRYDSKTSVEQALLRRRSVKEYKDRPLTLSDVSQLLWAAQGITDPETGFRTAPSAGALYPLEVYVVVGNVEGVKEGAYKYAPQEHQLLRVREGNVRDELAAVLGQTWVGKAAVVIVFFGVYERATTKFGDAGIRYVHMEVGHAAQNVYLQVISLNLGTRVIGGFPDKQVKKVLNVPENEQLLYIMPVGPV
jgi:SagB-type dehydrogenase family enzyme